MGTRANALAERLERGVRELEQFVSNLSDAEWKTIVQPDGRWAGVIVHHVANMYPFEIRLTQRRASGEAIAGVTWDAVADINRNHAHEHTATSKQDAVALLQKNSKAAADAVR